MFIKSLLKVFSGIFGMIFRYILIIGLCWLAAWFVGYILTMPFIWGGFIRLFGIGACILVIRFLIRLGRDKDEDTPAEEDFRS